MMAIWFLVRKNKNSLSCYSGLDADLPFTVDSLQNFGEVIQTVDG